jgi:hypothetical protein
MEKRGKGEAGDCKEIGTREGIRSPPGLSPAFPFFVTVQPNEVTKGVTRKKGKGGRWEWKAGVVMGPYSLTVIRFPFLLFSIFPLLTPSSDG